ncbi:MAG TPA: hypothetical protein DCY75_04405 [Clostridiales bacterium]|nr:hypothetical protein [Clostridiales bacterium]
MNMYDSIGEKIKLLAKLLAWITSGGFVVWGIILLDTNKSDGAIQGILLLLLGPLFSWMFTWLMYGFGELIQNTENILLRLPPPVQTPDNVFEPTQGTPDTIRHITGASYVPSNDLANKLTALESWKNELEEEYNIKKTDLLQELNRYEL